MYKALVAGFPLQKYESIIFFGTLSIEDYHCGLVVRVTGYRTAGPEFVSQRYHIFLEVVDLECGPIHFVRINEELLE
jgi:hypothetical protein